MTSSQWLADDSLLELLAAADLTIEGRLADASNATLRCTVDTGDERELLCVYKPVSGERPLWDFPEWTLSHRELAAHELSEAAGWGVVPPTVWRDDGPIGPGMCQLWIDEDPQAAKVAVVRPRQAPRQWKHVLDAEDGTGHPLQLVHAADEAIQRLAVFDGVINNADRKGGHVITDHDGRTWGIDHGVTFAVDDKLRTVLWGWAGEPLPDVLVSELEALLQKVGRTFDPIDRWLADDEREMYRRRIRDLLRDGTYPLPPRGWPAVPWPVF